VHEQEDLSNIYYVNSFKWIIWFDPKNIRCFFDSGIAVHYLVCRIWLESTNGVQQEDDLLLSRFKSILVLDDEFDFVTVIKRSLERQDFAVSAFTDPLLALEYCQQKPKNYETKKFVENTSMVPSDLLKNIT